MKSSYYTGYEDLDQKLLILHGRQTEIEREYSELIRKNQLTPKLRDILSRETHQINEDINTLLQIGKDRENFFNSIFDDFLGFDSS